MDEFELFKQGAESKIYKGIYLGKLTIAKERFKKNYRHEELDNTITKGRIRAEGRLIVRCKEIGVRTPTIYLIDYDRKIIFMEYFEYSITIKKFIEEEIIDKKLEIISFQIGLNIGKLHANNIIHGDLTSSNILLINKNNQYNFTNVEDLDLVFIDFGLAFNKSSDEDKGVDLYVLEKALNSTHMKAKFIFEHILDGYKTTNNNYKSVFNKLKEVRNRGRKRSMVG